MVQAQERVIASQSASQALWDAWAEANPQTPQEIDAFYRSLADYDSDLNAWHDDAARATWTAATVHIAINVVKARSVLDIGCGAGHDMRALRDALPEGTRIDGVELNERARTALRADGFTVLPDLAGAELDQYDLVTCFDVMEHVVDPESFVTDIGTRMRLGAMFIETTATDDIATPLHLKENWGWAPGRALERCGFILVDRQERFGVWQKVRTAHNPDRTSLVICSWRAVSIATQISIMNLAGIEGSAIDGEGNEQMMRMAASNWRIRIKSADGLISRSRSIIVSQWWRDCADDVLLMIDDDIGFTPNDAERIVALCRAQRSIVCGAYPVGDASSLAIRLFTHDNEIDFGPGQPLKEIEYGATGFMAIHRDVIDAMIAQGDFPLCHADKRWAFWPMFACAVAPMGKTYAYLSEDWSFCKLARDLGFKIWCDPTVLLAHVKEIQVGVGNMHHVAAAIKAGVR